MKTGRTGRRGFSFTEILFAVMILGIGFIMVAAMFPVAIQQTQNSGDETVGAALARSGAGYMAQVAQQTWPVPPNAPISSLLTPTFYPTFVPATYPSMAGLPPGTVVTLQGAVFSCYDTFHDNQIVNGDQHIFDLWGAVSPNIMQGSDPRYAWVAFYKRDWSLTQPAPTMTGGNIFSRPPYAQVIVIAVRARNTPTYTPADLLPSNTAEPSLIPSVGQATLKVNTIGATNTILSSQINFTGTTNASLRAAEGAFVVISNDYLPTTSPFHGLLNGHVYRIGTSIDAATWEFGPGDGLSAGDVTTLNLMGPNTQFDVFVVGRGADPNNPGQYIGPAQDVAVYSTFVPCPN